MKKKIINRSKLFKGEIKITIDENLKPSPIKVGSLVARKLAKATESLSKMKSLPNLSNEH